MLPGVLSFLYCLLSSCFHMQNPLLTIFPSRVLFTKEYYRARNSSFLHNETGMELDMYRRGLVLAWAKDRYV